jgi:hypothetical protein
MIKLNNIYQKNAFSKREIKEYVERNGETEYRRDKKRRIMFRGSIITTAIALFAIFVNLNTAADTYVTIDINPSIELVANAFDKVIEANPLNEDAEILLSDLDLIGLTLTEAAILITEEATEMGYIDELSTDNLVLVTVYEDDEEKQDEIGDEISEGIENNFENKGIEIAVKSQGITQEVKDTANDYGISNGKMMYIKKAVEQNEELVVENLVDLSMKEINQLMNENRKDDEESKALRLEEKEAKKEEQKAKVAAKKEEAKEGKSEEDADSDNSTDDENDSQGNENDNSNNAGNNGKSEENENSSDKNNEKSDDNSNSKESNENKTKDNGNDKSEDNSNNDKSDKSNNSNNGKGNN